MLEVSKRAAEVAAAGDMRQRGDRATVRRGKRFGDVWPTCHDSGGGRGGRARTPRVCLGRRKPRLNLRRVCVSTDRPANMRRAVRLGFSTAD
jgi:hypothetical protein